MLFKPKRLLLIVTLLLTAGILCAMPQIQRFLDVDFITGGVGLEEEQALEAMTEDYSLRILVAKKDKFLSDINIVIVNSEGQLMLEAVTDGPLMFVKLPAGKYAIEVSGYGEQFQRKVTVTEKRQVRVIFRWP